MDGRKNNGGARPNAGRKPKADEVKLVERLTPMSDDAYTAMHRGVKEGNPVFVKMWFEYMYGRPTQTLQNQQLDKDGNPIDPQKVEHTIVIKSNKPKE